MTARVRFVDSISTTAGLRLDLQLDPEWGVLRNGLDLRPASTRFVSPQSMLTDGAPVVARARDNMLLRVPILLKGGTDDARQGQMSVLARELERPSGFLEMQIRDATASRWLHTKGGSIVDYDPYYGQSMWRVVVELVADPWAYDTLRTLSAVTVSTDPAAASNPMVFDVTGVAGDEETPLILWTDPPSETPDGGVSKLLFAVRSRGVPGNLLSTVQAETDVAPGVDTALMANSALMSGAGSNYLRTTFATVAGMVMRWSTYIPSALATAAQKEEAPGEYRVLMRMSKTSSSAGIYVQWRTLNNVWGSGPVTAFPTVGQNNTRLWVDLGIINIGRPAGGLHAAAQFAAPVQLMFDAERRSGSGSLDWDVMRLVPADESMVAVANHVNNVLVIDGIEREAYGISSGSPFDATTEVDHRSVAAWGGFPHVTPGVTNRIYVNNLPDPNADDGVIYVSDLLTTLTINLAYYPRYLSV